MVNWIIGQIISRLFDGWQATLRGLIIALGAFLANYGVTLTPTFTERVIGWSVILLTGIQQLITKGDKAKVETK